MIHKILIADDASFIRKFISNTLIVMGFECIDAINGEDAIIKAFREKPDLIIMDINMPKVSGFVATREILKFNRDIKVIMCSCDCNENNVVESLSSGAIDFIAKPIKTERLLSAINNN